MTQFAGFIGALIGFITAYAILKTHIANVKEESYQDAYESGWANGYEVGVRQARPKRTRKPKSDL